MRGIQKDLVNYLQKQQPRWTTAKELAAYCGCTTRTIRNHIAKIKKQDPDVLLTSHQGYRLNKATCQPAEITDSEERISQLFLRLLKKASAGVDLYELAEQLYVSEATLKHDLQQLKKELSNDELQIKITHSQVMLVGAERDKRRYMISLLYKEGRNQELLRAYIQEMIGYISLSQLQKTIEQVLKKHHLMVNQYSLNNIVLHFAISIERIRQGNELLQTDEKLFLTDSEEYQIAREIAVILEEAYLISFGEIELQQLALLFIGLQHEALTNHRHVALSEFVDPLILTTLEQILKEVEETYLIRLQDRQFFVKFAIHLQSLYQRSKFATFTRNSSLLDIKTAYPVTYDVAVYISSLLQERLGIWFNDDEISFIALHIGTCLEMERTTPKIRLLFVIDSYHDVKEQMTAKLMARFGSEISLQHASVQEINDHHYDILVTTNRDVASEVAGAVFVYPLLTEKDLHKIQKRLQLTKQNERKKQIYGFIDHFIQKELYFHQVDPAQLTTGAIRQQMVQRMLEHDFVSGSFGAKVEKREHLSPTSFPSGIAVPHSLEHDALKSGISIMTLQEPIIWCDYPVVMIALLAINKEDAEPFNQFFEKFVEIVSEETNTKQLAMSMDFAEFKGKLKMLVGMEE